MTVEWYLKIADKEVGPLSAQQLRTMAGKGQIGPEDLVRQGNEGGWVPASHVKGLLAAAVSAGPALSEAIPVAKLLTPANGKSPKAKTPATAAPARKRKLEPGKTAKAIEEPAAESSLPPVVAKGSLPPPPPPTPPLPVPPLLVPSVAGVQAVNGAAAIPPAVSEPEAEPAMVPPSRHSPGIELPFDVSPPTGSGAHAKVAVEKTSAAGPGKAPAAKEKPKFQVNYTIVAVAVVVVAAAGLFIFASMSGSGSRDKSGKPTTVAPTEKSPEEGPKETPTSPDAAKQPPSEDPLASLVLGPKGKLVGPPKPPIAPAKSPEKKPDQADSGAKEKWVDVSKEPAVGKNVSIAVKTVRYSRVKKDDAVTLVLKVTNNVKERRLKCQWDALRQVQPDSMMVDSFDSPNSYRFLGAKIDGKAIDPEESREATLYFEKPIKTAKYVHLKLPGAVFSEKDPVKLEIPLEMIKPADENADEDSGPATQGPPVPSDQPKTPKGIPGVDAPAGPEGPAPVLPVVPGDTRWQPRRDRDVELADAGPRRPAAVREQRITDFDDDPATVERFGQPSRTGDPDRRGSRHAVQR
jgi:hypothetical protein